MSTRPDNQAPLEGLRVVEFGQIAAGPFAGSLLADLGADVVKVERPGSGDGMRQWPPLVGDSTDKFSENFASVNRNKRSIVCELKDPDELRRLKDLISRADVLVENFRPGVMDRLGLGYEELRTGNAKLVYCSLSGYGQQGPYRSRGAFDVTIQAMSGVMSVTGERGGEPAKCGVPVGDFVAGLYGALTVLAAILRARDTERGAHIDCSMLGALLGIAALQTSEYFGTGQDPQRLGSAHPRNAPYQAFRAKDDDFVLAAGNDQLWHKLCDLVDRKELPRDPRFLTQDDRARNQAELENILQPVFSQKTAAEWLRDLDGAGIPSAPINTYSDVLHDAHVKHMNLLHEMPLPNGVKTTTVGFPIPITDFEFTVRRPPPTLGQHTEEVFAEWGLP